MTITYTKLKDGKWGVRGRDLKPGQTVTVTKRNGETKQEQVDEIILRDEKYGTIATIVKNPAYNKPKDPMPF